ncbi:hypothetical protein ACIBK9_36230 [Nonomuraea sp. NPDC050227]|uniref:hypothetical protein n=1 Tax=Nonomuraea sp. NPDC050227 TaxID=3364360 RepID=UPI0037B41CAA
MPFVTIPTAHPAAHSRNAASRSISVLSRSNSASGRASVIGSVIGALAVLVIGAGGGAAGRRGPGPAPRPVSGARA